MRTFTTYMLTFCIGFLCLYVNTVKAQQNTDAQLLLKDAEASVFNDPDYGIKISEFTLNNNPSPKTECQSLILQGKSYYLKGDYNAAFKSLISAKVIAQNLKDTNTSIQINILIADVLNRLDLYPLSISYLNEIEHSIDAQTEAELTAKRLQYKASINTLKNENSDAVITDLLKAESLLKSKSINKENLSPIELDLASYYLNKFQLDSAMYYVQTLNAKPYIKNQYISMIRLNITGSILFHQKDFLTAIDSLKKGYAIAERFNNTHLKSEINEQLVSSYIAINNKTAFLDQNLNSNLLNNESNKLKLEAKKNILNHTELDSTKAISELTASYKKSIIILLAIVGLLVCLGFIYKFVRDKRIKQYSEILKYFEDSNNISTATQPMSSPSIKETNIETPSTGNPTETTTERKPKVNPTNENSKTLNIPKETEQIILSKLKQFEKTNKFTSKDMSLGQLAAKLDTNTKYLSEIINNNKGKNFNSYINELRINYVINKLKTEPQYLNYKVSYLANESGFSSHSSFATVFKTVTGVSPSAFINIVKKEYKA